MLFKFFVDVKLFDVGIDGVVCYVVVIMSLVGVCNVNYEGICCDIYEWCQYVGLNVDYNGWDCMVENDWWCIENGELNVYYFVFYQDYFCVNKMLQGLIWQIFENIWFYCIVMMQLC